MVFCATWVSNKGKENRCFAQKHFVPQMLFIGDQIKKNIGLKDYAKDGGPGAV